MLPQSPSFSFFPSKFRVREAESFAARSKVSLVIFIFLYFSGQQPLESHPNKTCFTAADPGLEVLQMFLRFPLFLLGARWVEFSMQTVRQSRKNTIFHLYCGSGHLKYLHTVNPTHLLHFSTLKQMLGNVIQGSDFLEMLFGNFLDGFDIFHTKGH